MPRVEVEIKRCKSCGLCIEFCPKKVLQFGEQTNIKGYHFVVPVNQDQCIGCALCGMVCPDIALTIYREKKFENK